MNLLEFKSKLENRLKRLKNKKGFTLVELMIVVAVIGILAVVLLPRVGTIKTQAKEAGIDTNMRMVQSVVQAKISNYIGQGSGSANGPGASETAFENDIIKALNGGTSVDQNAAIKNPFVSLFGAADTTSLAFPSPITNEVYIAVEASKTAPTSIPGYTPATTGTNPTPASVAPVTGAAGEILINIFSTTGNSGGDLVAEITPYDAYGTPMLSKQVTIKP